jgi:hypothetical protein
VFLFWVFEVGFTRGAKRGEEGFSFLEIVSLFLDCLPHLILRTLFLVGGGMLVGSH